MRVVYLHGFASSPSSRKARFFSEKLAAAGIQAEVLDLAPDFERLTISGQLKVMEAALQSQPAVLVGSSMGGYLAALYAARHPEIARLVLLAPAFDFYALWTRELGPERLEEWRVNGTLSVFNYGSGRQVPLDYQMIEDAEQYEAYPTFEQPCLVLHGLRDRVVPFQKSVQFAEDRPNVKLLPFESGHELTDVLDEIWEASYSFFDSAP